MAELIGIIKVNGHKSVETPCNIKVSTQQEIEHHRQIYSVDGYDIWFRLKKVKYEDLTP